ncbi:DUF4097 family beta strand repeat-containing protein [Kribbella sp. NPDC004138]
MSEPSQEGTGVRARYSRWRATSRGRKTLKAAYAQAARDVMRMDPAVRERIGRANMTQSDLQQLASLHVDAQMRPDRYAGVSERLGQRASDRLQEAGPAPRQPRVSRTRNPVRRIARRYSRWGRNERRGTKALKAALTQAAKDIKRTDPSVLRAIGRSTLNSADLAALASSRMDEVFRPEGRFQGVPGQQNGAGRQGQGIQSRDAVRQTPQQSEQVAQRIAALQQSILESQQQMLTLMEENNRLQAEMRQLLEARVQQLQQENAGTDPALEPGRDQQREGVNQLEPSTGQEPGERAEGGPEGEPRATGDAEVGEPRAVGEAEVGDDNGPQVGEGGEPRTPQAGPEVDGAEARNPAEDWTVSSETQGESARSAEAQERPLPTGELDAPAAGTQDPASTPGPAVVPQQPGTDQQLPAQGPQEPAAGEAPTRTPSTRRELVADTPGPVTIDAELMRSAGKVTVRVDPNCTQARLEISTADTEGPSAEAVQRATLGQSPDGVLSAKVAGTSNGSVITTGNGIQISGYSGSIHVNGVQINGDGSATPAPSPIEVTAVVPPGSVLSAQTQSADIEASGLDIVEARSQSGDVRVDTAQNVAAETQSGDVSVDRAQKVDARSQSGDVRVGRVEDDVRAKTQSGNVSVDQFAGGSARVGSMSGNARIHVVDRAENGPRIVRAESISGNATVSTSNEGVAQNLNADATSMTGRASAPPRASTAPLHQSGQSSQSGQGARPDHQMPGRQSPTARGPASER